MEEMAVPNLLLYVGRKLFLDCIGYNDISHNG